MKWLWKTEICDNKNWEKLTWGIFRQAASKKQIYIFTSAAKSRVLNKLLRTRRSTPSFGLRRFRESVIRYFVTEPCSKESARNVKRKTIYNPKKDKERMRQYMHWKKAAAQALLLAVGTAMLCSGALRGEAATVLSKAIRLCLECVGIG